MDRRTAVKCYDRINAYKAYRPALKDPHKKYIYHEWAMTVYSLSRILRKEIRFMPGVERCIAKG